MFKTFFTYWIKKLGANLKLNIKQNNKLESTKDIYQKLLKTSNLCMLMNAL